MIIKLSKAEVEIKENITYGDSIKIAKALGKSSIDEMINAQYVLLEISISKIIDNGLNVKWSREWQDNLSKEDGELLLAKCVENSQKKTQ